MTTILWITVFICAFGLGVVFGMWLAAYGSTLVKDSHEYAQVIDESGLGPEVI